MKSSTVDIPLLTPKYHFHHEKGRVRLHLPTWLLVLLAVCIGLLAAASITLSYKLLSYKEIDRTAQSKVRSGQESNGSLIQPHSPTPIPPKTPSKAAPAPPVKIDSYNTGLALDPGLQQILDAYNEVTPPAGVVVLDITDKRYAAIEPDQVRTAASLYKLFVARELYDFNVQGKLSFDQMVTVTQAAVNQDSSDPNLPVGTTIQVSECLRRMITISDNACGYLLGSLISWNNVNETLNIRGYSHTSLGSDQLTSAGDIGLLLRRVAEGQMVTPDSSHNLEAILFEQQINTRLPALLPPGVIGHKTGDLNGLAHDAGIVRTKDKSYVIVVLSGPWKDVGKANNSIAKLSLQVYDYILNFKPQAN